MQKIAVLSDIHGNIAALEAVVDHLSTRQVDCVVNLGDHVSGPLWPKETIQYLMKQDWVQIRGNHDRQLVCQDPNAHGLSDAYAYQRLNDDERAWLKALPASAELPNGMLAFHGAPFSDSTYLLETVEHGRLRLAAPAEIKARLGETSAPLILCGHTHIQRVVCAVDGRMMINPGSVGLPAYEDDHPEQHVVESGSPHARYAVLEYKNGHWDPEMIAVAYDHHKAADQARKNGRPDWEIGLRTGFMRLE